MAYFECIIGGGGGGESDVNLIVTCSPNFAGKTITCTNGTDTYTQTCPSTSPYTVTFENIAKGTWTVSGVISGQTFSQSVVIGDYTAELNDTPEGATVTPVNDIQIWLHCANIWDKTYTTISQVLSDTSTLLALISSNNAADYMARSTNWASSVCANSTAMGYIGNNNYCANKLIANSTWRTAICNSSYFESVLNAKVPTMTSDTTPSGVASASSVFPGSYEAYKAFDNVNTSIDCWLSGNGGTTSEKWVQYQFTNAVSVLKMRTIFETYWGSVSTLSQVRIEASNDGSNFSVIKTISNPSSMTEYTNIENSTKYKYWRFVAKGYNANSVAGGVSYAVAVRILQFYGVA